MALVQPPPGLAWLSIQVEVVERAGLMAGDRVLLGGCGRSHADTLAGHSSRDMVARGRLHRGVIGLHHKAGRALPLMWAMLGCNDGRQSLAPYCLVPKPLCKQRPWYIVLHGVEVATGLR